MELQPGQLWVTVTVVARNGTPGSDVIQKGPLPMTTSIDPNRVDVMIASDEIAARVQQLASQPGLCLGTRGQIQHGAGADYPGGHHRLARRDRDLRMGRSTAGKVGIA
jgi:hypothetical protein